MTPDKEFNWIVAFTFIDSLNRIFYGMYSTFLGPSQPYLARKVGVDIDTISWIQPFANLFALVGSVIGGLIFKTYFVSEAKKLSYLVVFTLLLAISSILPLYSSTFATLIFVVSLRSFLGQILEIPCQGIYVYTLGAKRSQPFVMLFHSTVAIGFFLGPVILGPFFPENEDNNQKNDICNGTSTKSDESDRSNVNEVIESIKWAYWIMLIGHVLCAIGYLAIYFSPSFEMPVYGAERNPQKKDSGLKIRSEIKILSSIAIFYGASCGSERLFQTLEFTFGLCGPLHLSSRQAVITDKCYNGGFLVGRLASIMAVKLMKPKMMLKSSLVLCALSTLALSLKADESANLLYICATLFGFAISWQFGSGVSWSAEYMDVVGWRASTFNAGCSLSFVASVTGAYLFSHFTPMFLWHFNFILVFVQIVSFYKLNSLFGKMNNEKSESTKYKQLSQQEFMEEISLNTASSDEEF